MPRLTHTKIAMIEKQWWESSDGRAIVEDQWWENNFEGAVVGAVVGEQ